MNRATIFLFEKSQSIDGPAIFSLAIVSNLKIEQYQQASDQNIVPCLLRILVQQVSRVLFASKCSSFSVIFLFDLKFLFFSISKFHERKSRALKVTIEKHISREKLL